jgi:hypothetical protein
MLVRGFDGMGSTIGSFVLALRLVTSLFTIHALHDVDSNVIIVFLGPEAEEVVSRHLEAEPGASHRRSDLEEIRGDAFVETANAFLGCDHADGVENTLVLVAHAGHGVNLEAAAEDVTVTDLSNMHASA